MKGGPLGLPLAVRGPTGMETDDRTSVDGTCCIDYPIYGVNRELFRPPLNQTIQSPPPNGARCI